jgi:hypothetical protein
MSAYVTFLPNSNCEGFVCELFFRHFAQSRLLHSLLENSVSRIRLKPSNLPINKCIVLTFHLI